MLSPILNFNKINTIKPLYVNNNNNNYKNRYTNLAPLRQDTVSFTGMSIPSKYKTVYEYLAADIASKNQKYGVNGSCLSSSNIGKTMDKMQKNGTLYLPFQEASKTKIRWKNYVPDDVREFCVDKINQAREIRLDEWKSFLENPEAHEEASKFPNLVKKTKDNNPMKFVIWHAINTDLKANNRHIPVPFDVKALDETVNSFDAMPPKDRALRCISPTFLEMYTHRLRDNLLMEKGILKEKTAWVKIPSYKHDRENNEKNIHDLEILSCRNWCTRSSVDKAKDALLDGDFYVFLERDSKNMWSPQIGMATSRNKVDQIQGVENNNLIPLNQIANVKEFIKKEKLDCVNGIVDEGPKAAQEIMIADKLAQHDELFDKTLDKAIKEKDSFAVFSMLGKKVEHKSDNTLEIETYKPIYVADKQKGITIPYSMMGIEEDVLLRNVSKIKGDMMLYNKNFIYNSQIKEFPQKLEEVTGKVVCNQKQYDKFAEDINRVVNGDSKRIVVYDK